MKKSIASIVCLLATLFAVNLFAADCRILGVREIPETTSGVNADFEIVVNVALVAIGSGPLFFHGQEYPDRDWTYEREIRDNGNGTATIIVPGWKAGESIEFTYGRYYGMDPGCSAYRYGGHLRVKLGEPKDFAMPWLIPLLLNGKPKQPKIVSIVESNVNGPTAYYSITVGLNSLPIGVPFFTGQSYPNGPWVYYGIKDNGNGTATTTIPNWSRGSFFEFTFGTVSGSTQNWVDPVGSPYLYADHFGATLGQAQSCTINNTGDSLVLKVTNLGGDNYRVFLNFPIEEGYKSLFLKGQNYQDGPWINWLVTSNYPCHYADIYWPYDGTFHFSFGVIKNDNTERWIDPTLSSFRCTDHLCINFRYP